MRRGDGVLYAVDVPDDEDELVAAEAGRGLARPHAVHEPVADLLEHGVPRFVAQAVVHDLEPVEVEEEHGDVGAVPAVPCQFLVQAVEEQGPVGQAGEGVVERLVGERLLGLDLLGDVLDGHDVAGLAVPAPGRRQHPDVADLASGALDPERGRHLRPLPADAVDQSQRLRRGRRGARHRPSPGPSATRCPGRVISAIRGLA